MGQKDDENHPWLFSLKSVQRRQRQIGQELERIWGRIVHEPVPDEMLDLLKKLDDKDRGRHDA